MPNKRRPSRKLRRIIDPDATIREQMRAPMRPARPGESQSVFIDEDGQPRRLNFDEMSDEERDAALESMGEALGSLPREDLKTAAVERLTELYMAGQMTEEQYRAERERLEGY